MAIRKSTEESFVVDGSRDDLLSRCEASLKANGFSNVQRNDTLGQIEADHKKFIARGSIIVTVSPEGERSRITAKVSANVDNVYALFKSPGKTIMDAFKKGL